MPPIGPRPPPMRPIPPPPIRPTPPPPPRPPIPTEWPKLPPPKTRASAGPEARAEAPIVEAVARLRMSLRDEVVLQGLDVHGWTFPIPIGRGCRRKVHADQFGANFRSFPRKRESNWPNSALVDCHWVPAF